MRILILCIATFAAGALLGAMILSDEDGAGRSRTREATREDRGFESRSSSSWETEEREEEGGRATGGAARADAPRLGRLAAGARAALERFETGDVAQLIEEADGSISGIVLDPSGRPVPGVVVTAVPETRPFDLVANWRAARKTPHKDRDLATVAQEAIHNELWRRMVRRSATSGPNGRYEITGLMDTGHNLTAFHDRFDLRPLTPQRGRIQPDATVDFTASAVLETKVEVRMPDGSLAEHASLQWQGPHGRGGDSWMKEPGRVRIPVGTVKVKATTTVPEPMESKEVEREIAADRAGDPLVLTLEGRKILTARLVLPEGFALPRTVEYRMRKVEGDEIDPKDLLKDQSQRHARSPSPGRAHWYDLEPGRYLVAAFLNRRRLLAHAIAEVGEGPAEVELPVEEPDTGDTVQVKLVGPDGGPVPGEVSFRVVTETKGRKSTKTADALPQGDVWLVYLDGIAKGGRDGAPGHHARRHARLRRRGRGVHVARRRDHHVSVRQTDPALA